MLWSFGVAGDMRIFDFCGLFFPPHFTYRHFPPKFPSPPRAISLAITHRAP
jgi:hypothetical protein